MHIYGVLLIVFKNYFVQLVGQFWPSITTLKHIRLFLFPHIYLFIYTVVYFSMQV